MEISNELRNLVDTNNECCCEHSFANKCKEWALKNKYKIQSQINASNKGHSHITKKNDDCWAKGFFENTEIEAIIKACEYILKEINEKR